MIWKHRFKKLFDPSFKDLPFTDKSKQSSKLNLSKRYDFKQEYPILQFVRILTWVFSVDKRSQKKREKKERGSS